MTNAAELKHDLREYAALSFDALEDLAGEDPHIRLSAGDIERLRELRREYLAAIEGAQIPKSRLRSVK